MYFRIIKFYLFFSKLLWFVLVAYLCIYVTMQDEVEEEVISTGGAELRQYILLQR